MMVLVVLPQALKNFDGLVDRRRLHDDRLEAALEGAVLLDVLPVFGERRRTDTL